jgi:hypothetical protein
MDAYLVFTKATEDTADRQFTFAAQAPSGSPWSSRRTIPTRPPLSSSSQRCSTPTVSPTACPALSCPAMLSSAPSLHLEQSAV